MRGLLRVLGILGIIAGVLLTATVALMGGEPGTGSAFGAFALLQGLALGLVVTLLGGILTVLAGDQPGV